jgi:hypothetical protein
VKAQQLADKYKSLTNRSELPQHLVDTVNRLDVNLLLPATGTPYTISSPLRSVGLSDLVMGMAQNTDPKNLVNPNNTILLKCLLLTNAIFWMYFDDNFRLCFANL